MEISFFFVPKTNMNYEIEFAEYSICTFYVFEQYRHHNAYIVGRCKCLQHHIAHTYLSHGHIGNRQLAFVHWARRGLKYEFEYISVSIFLIPFAIASTSTFELALANYSENTYIERGR